jgi:pimeloyl-ACP methyl ester carboxylesterase
VTLGSGVALSYCEEGDGVPLVQVHGLGTGRRNFDLIRPHLAARLRVYDLDLPGYGDSDTPDRPRSTAEFADDVAGFIEALELGPAHVHGGSMGGQIALVLAARRPELVDRLVITCASGRADEAALMMFKTWRTAARAGSEALAELTTLQGFSRGFWDRPEASGAVDAFVTALSTTTPEEFLRDLVAIEAADLEDELPRVRAQTLLLGADEDVMTPVSAAGSGLGMSDMERLIPNAQLRVLEECGHFITIERPLETATHIADWVLAA